MTSSVHDEVGGDPDKEYQAEVPNSPSSSGGFHEFILMDYVEKICHSIFLVETWKFYTRLLYAPNVWF